MNRYIYSIVAVIFFSCFSFGQIEDRRICGTTQFLNTIYEHNPEKKQIAEQLELFTQEYISNIQARSAQETFIIPVVVHVVHEYGDENLSYEEIEEGILQLNDDFSAQNADIADVVSEFTSIIGDSGIEFRLATIDPDGNCTYGVNRIASSLTSTLSSGDRVEVEKIQNLIAWDDKKYLNIWIVKEFVQDPGSYGTVLAFANYPGSGVVVDGIFCRYNYFTNDHTLSHEMGHSFNLAHPWGGGELTDEFGVPREENCLDDDGVEDTPNTRGSFGCWNTLQQQEDYACEEGVLENNQNIMNYSSCTNMFTQGQGLRMRAAAEAFAGNRRYLWQPENLEITGTDDLHYNSSNTYAECAPIPDFKSDIDLGCAGTDILFDNFSYNYTDLQNVTFSWVFEEGIPTASTDMYPAVQYNKPGTYNVSLTACNGDNCQTLTKNNYITILSKTDIPADEGITELEGFEDESFPNMNVDNLNEEDDEIWWIGNDHDEQHWERTTLSSTEGSSSFRIKSENYGDERRSHEFSTPTLNLSDFSSSSNDPLTICFDYAYARRLPYNKVNYDESTGLINGDVEGFSMHNDALVISYKTSCDAAWNERPRLSTRPGEEGTFLNKQESLITTDKIYFNDNFVPADHEWNTYCLNVQAVAGQEDVILKFEFVGTGDTTEDLHWINANGVLLEITSSSLGGNWLYIDNFIIGNETEIEAMNCASYDSWDEAAESNETPNQYSWCEWCAEYNNEFEYWVDFNSSGMTWGNPNVVCDCCPPPTWNCTPNGCVFSNDGDGVYDSLEDCESACVSTWNCVPDDGCTEILEVGTYTSIEDCEAELACMPTWDCDPDDGCIEKLEVGVYTSLEECEEICSDDSFRTASIKDLLVTPNPSIINESLITFNVVSDGEFSISLTNLFGKNIGVKTFNLSTGKQEFLLSELFNISSKGTYIIKVEESDSHLSEIILIQ